MTPPPATSSSAPLIALTNVDVTHENAPEDVVVAHVNWSIDPGDLWVVGGEIGTGKSTLLATAAGLARSSAGAVCIFGKEVGEATESEQVGWRQQIGMVFEGNGGLLGHLTVAGNVSLPLLYHTAISPSEAEAVVEEALERAGLAPYAHWLPSRLSARVQQRISLVRALITPKRVLFLDNVLGSLTPSAAQWWIDQVRQARDRAAHENRPLAVVASANDMRGWLDTATKFALIHDRQFHVLNSRDEAQRQGINTWNQLTAPGVN